MPSLEIGGTRLWTIVTAALLAAQAAPVRAHGITERVSLGPRGVQGNNGSAGPAVTADGRFVAFASIATNLVPGDTNGFLDVFVRDRQTGTTERVSFGPGGVQGNGDSFAPAISADGRFVTFDSDASNLVPGDTNGFLDVFVRDRRRGTTERVSLGPRGAQPNGSGFTPAISADGQFVAFVSSASNLVLGDTNELDDVFVRDRRRGTTQRVSLGPRGAQGNGISVDPPSISADGRFVAFDSDASNLVPGDTNDSPDVFVRDLQAGTTRRVSLGTGSVEGNGFSLGQAISPSGRFVAFASNATNLVPGDTNGAFDVFVRDRQTGTTRRVSLGPGGVQGNNDSGESFSGPAISADGRFVAFASNASNLVRGDTNDFPDAFIHDCRTSTTRRLSLGPGGIQGNGFSDTPAISARGNLVAFVSEASNLVLSDTNDVGDVFVRIPAP